MRLIIVRHAHRDDDAFPDMYSKNRNNNCPISKQGIEDTKKRWDSYFKKEGKSIVIYASPFLRTQQTADIIAKCYSSTTDKKVIKITDNLLCEGQNLYSPDFENELFRDLKDSGVEYQESLEDIKDRVKRSLNRIIKENEPDSNIILVTHGIICGCILDNMLKDFQFYDDRDKDIIKFGVGDYCTLSNDTGEWRIVESSFIDS